MIILNKTAITAIKKSTKLKGQLQVALDISSNTLYKYLREDSPNLTTASALDAIRKETGLKDSDLLTTK